MRGYDTDVHRWLVQQARREGITVVTGDPSLTVACYSHRETRTLWLKDGLSLDSFHWTLARAERHILFGEVPAGAVDVPASPKPQLRLISGGVR